MTSINSTKGFMLYLLKSRAVYVVTVALVSIWYLLCSSRLGDVANNWTTRVEPLLSVMTFITALAVFLWEAVQDWKSDLPKKLTVIYKYGSEEVMRCNRADLVSEADIRALGQQLGSQMANGYQKLMFRAPCVKPSGGRVAHDSNGASFLDYTVTFELTELPPDLRAHECVTWNPPFGALERIPRTTT